MRRLALIFLLLNTLCIVSFEMYAQESIPKSKTNLKGEDEEDGPLMFKFEPDYLHSVSERRDEIIRQKEILDTLDITDRQRKRLLKDLHTKKMTKRLSKVLVTDNKFEYPEE